MPYTYDPVPTLSSVTPSAGTPLGGTVVTLTGTGFRTGATTVTFGAGNHGTTVHVTGTTTLTVTTPHHSLGTVTVTVTTPGGTSGNEPYTYDPVPTLTKVTPSAGTLGGTVVTLTGTGFRTGATSVTFGAGNHGTTIHVLGTTSLTVKAPGHTAATVTVTVTTPGGTSNAKPYTYDPIPTLGSVTPSAGKVSGGTPVTLTGTGFVTGATSVKFGTTTARSWTVTSPTTIVAVTEAHGAGTVTVTVTTPGGTSDIGHYTYDPVPTLTKVTPSAGKLIGGTVVTLTGTGFRTGATTVTFGAGNHGTTVHVTGTSTLTVKSPGHSPGTVTVTVTTPGGTSGTKRFTYDPVPTLTKVTPSAGTLGGTVVTLTGTGFRTGATTVTFGAGNHGTTIHVSGTTTLTVTTPGHSPGTVTVTVTTPGGTSGTEPYTYDPAPTLSTVTPSAGKVAGGTVVTLTGTGFRTGATSVTFGVGNHGTTVHVTGTTTLTVTTPHHTLGAVTVTVTTPGGTSGAKPYTYDPVPTLSTVTPSAGTLGGTVVTLTGSGFRTGATTVTFGAGNHGLSVHVTGTTTLTVSTPGHSPGTVTVTVTTPGGTSGTKPYTYDPVPMLTKVTPSAGKLGGTVVTLTGTGFRTGATTVTFGAGHHGTTVHVTGTTTLTVTTPGHAAGTVTVTVTTPGGTSGTEPYTYDPVPTLTKVTPSAGKLGGTVVTLTGTGFRTGATTVTFGAGHHGTTVHVTGTTTLTVTTPGHSSGTVTVTVTTPGGTSGTKPYTYDPVPTLSALTPTGGKLVGGTLVTLTGSGFRTGATTVTFGAGHHGTTVHVTGTTTLTVKTPNHAAGTVTVTVTTPGGTSGSKHYTYGAIPTLTKVTPSAGKLGGTTVTLTGTSFGTGIYSVTFGAGNHGTTVHVTGTTTLTVKTPGHSAGTVTVTVTTPGGTSNAKPYTYDPVPTLASVAPPAGTLGGTVVTLTGTGFRTGATTVTFGAGHHGTTVHVSSTTSLTVKAPSHAPGTVTVTITTPGGTSAAKPYIYDPAPTLSKVTPSGGKLVGGTVITITGSGFRTGSTTVTFGAGNHGTTVHVTGTTTLTVKSPAHAAGTVTVTVTTPGGTSAAKPYNYDPVPAITSLSRTGPLAGGNTVTITGTGFSTVTSVKFATLTATSFIVRSSIQILAVAPAHAAGTVRISVTTLGGTTPSTPADIYKYAYPVPAVTTVTPPSGPAPGGTVVTVVGSGFTGATAVYFGTTKVTTTIVVNARATQLTVKSPVGVSGASVNVRVVTPGGESPVVTADLFTYGPTISSLSRTSGPVAGGTNVTITGAGFSGVVNVKFGTSTARSYTVRSATQIVAVSPAHAAGQVRISVTTGAGTTPATSHDLYTFH